MKPVIWIGSSLDDLRHLPMPVRHSVGYALELAQRGERHLHAKTLKGFRGASVVEIVEDHAGNTYRAVYTVKLSDAIYVLHVFQKKSKRGISTPKRDIDLIQERLKIAQRDHQDRFGRG